MDFVFKHKNGKVITVALEDKLIKEHLEDDARELMKCDCEPIGETPFTDCTCCDYFDEFKLVMSQEVVNAPQLDNWNQYDRIIQEISGYSTDMFSCTGGECATDETTLFRLLIVDNETGCNYRMAINSEWCPEDRKKWLFDVLIGNLVHVITKAKNDQKMATRVAWNKFKESI